MTTAVIVGAGIGGLAAGIALQRAGLNVRIHEQASRARELTVRQLNFDPHRELRAVHTT